MRTRPVLNFFQVASLVMLLVAVALLAADITMHFAIHGVEVKVPSLKGMTESEARSQTSGLGLNLDVDNRYYSGDVTAGHILSQSPAAGTVVRREWRGGGGGWRRAGEGGVVGRGGGGGGGEGGGRKGGEGGEGGGGGGRVGAWGWGRGGGG